MCVCVCECVVCVCVCERVVCVCAQSWGVFFCVCFFSEQVKGKERISVLFHVHMY